MQGMQGMHVEGPTGGLNALPWGVQLEDSPR